MSFCLLSETHWCCEGNFTHTVLPTPGRRCCADCAAELAWGSDTAPLPGFLPAAWSVPRPSVFPLLLFSRDNEVSQKWLRRKNVPKVETLLQWPPVTEQLHYFGQITVSSNFGLLTYHNRYHWIFPPLRNFWAGYILRPQVAQEWGTQEHLRSENDTENILSRGTKACAILQPTSKAWFKSTCTPTEDTAACEHHTHRAQNLRIQELIYCCSQFSSCPNVSS